MGVMVCEIDRLRWVFAFAVALFALVGCTPVLSPDENKAEIEDKFKAEAQCVDESCSSLRCEIMLEIANNREFKSYSPYHFMQSTVNILWPGTPRESEVCERSANLVFFGSSSSFDRNSEFIAIEKMYIEGDVAFVELGFPPSGKNGDALLRRVSGAWTVVRVHLWEN